ncbi:reelin domain-containing protein 1-like [Pimephales promelas]|uniref:reelin domain-containing protein 1-like n=1 Tax=Pimephales promelas TaxID=90988 RepID=UPI001955B346|nr:reelin domain-containing protein 1-like [Pimephales promelas]XP_039516893.1 reelin domain-containing protein 1-like [Pimephales promelas]
MKMMMEMMKMMMKAVLAGCVIICVFSGRGVCFSRGASVSSCVSMKPGHISSFPQHTRTHSSVTIHTSRSVYLPQHTLTVTVQSSRAFMGFLLQARSVLEDRVVGEFTHHPPSTHTLSCLDTDDTVTHSDKTLKRNLSFSWRAPTHPSGDLRFYITLVQSYFVSWSRIRSAVVHDGTRTRQTTGSIREQTGKHTSLSKYTTTSTNTTPSVNTHTNTQLVNVTQTPLSSYRHTPTHTNTYAPYNTNTNTVSTYSTHTTPSVNTHTNTQSLNNTQTSLSSYKHTSTHTFPRISTSHSSTIAKIDTNIHKTTQTHTVSDLLSHTHSADTQATIQQTHTLPKLQSHTHTADTHTSTQQTHTVANLLSQTHNADTHTTMQQTHTLPNLLSQTHSADTHTSMQQTNTVPNLLSQTQSTDTQASIQQTHTYTPSVHTHNTQIFTASLHPEALRRSLSNFFPSWEPTEGAVSLTPRKKDTSNQFRDVPKHAKNTPGVPERGNETPEHTPGKSTSELGLLLGLSGALGMAVAVGLRYLQRKHCRKRTAVSLNDCNHEDRGIIHVQECGDLVQVRKIRQNSFLVLQAEYNLITPPAN